MKKKIILLSMLLLCSFTAIWAQAKPNDGFDQKATELEKKINQTFKDKESKVGERMMTTGSGSHLIRNKKNG